MPEPIFCCLAFSVVVDIIASRRQSTRRNNKRFVERVQKSSEVLQTLLNAQNDAVQDYGVVLENFNIV
jgi:hypothetical protein